MKTTLSLGDEYPRSALLSLAIITEAIFRSGSSDQLGRISYNVLLDLMPGDKHAKSESLAAALTLLYGMGLVEIDVHGSVGPTSRHAFFALASLSAFFQSGHSVVSVSPSEEEKSYLLNLTKSLEAIRRESTNVSRAPIHFRRIVNVIIKSRKVRRGRIQDVYLHVFHRTWEKYHLIGLSHKDSSKTDREIAELALEKQVGLIPGQYVLAELDSDHSVTMLSGTSGALTEYTYRVFVVNQIHVKMHLRRFLMDRSLRHDTFRWFTWKEISQLESDRAEAIMFSTPDLLRDVRDSVPVSAATAEDMRGQVNLLQEVLNRFTYGQLAAFFLGVFMMPVIYFFPRVLDNLEVSSPLLDNLANISDILALALPTSITVIVLRVLGRDSPFDS